MKKILGAMRRADERFKMIGKGDKIAVGLSGGKDSMLLLYALQLYQRYSKNDFELSAITVDLGFGNYDTDVMQKYADDLHLPLYIMKTDISEIVFDIRKEKNPCALCAKMRKGVLYEKAKALGCNKAAFAHHGDDVTETLLMSLMYEGRMNTFAPKAYLTRSDITLIRPFVFLREKDIASTVSELNIPIAKNPCPVSFSTKREQTKELVRHLDSLCPDASKHILGAIGNTETYHLWDKNWDF
ncbi:MAG: ATP-binding protein [Christensenella sp.]